MRGIRKQAQHETLSFQKHALIGEELTDFKVGDRVMTVDGFPGKVSSISFGPFQSSEDYEVVLDGGMGGGTYSSGQLTALKATTSSKVEAAEVYASIPFEATTDHTANNDYPELENILSERLPNENIKVFASKPPTEQEIKSGKVHRTCGQLWSEHGEKKDGTAVCPTYGKKTAATGELENILSERLPNENIKVFASRTAGVNGNLPEGMTIHHERFDPYDDGSSYHYISAHHKGQEIGALSLRPGGEVDTVGVEDNYQRRGVASALWDHAKKLGLNPYHSDNMTKDGEAWAKHTAANSTVQDDTDDDESDRLDKDQDEASPENSNDPKNDDAANEDSELDTKPSTSPNVTPPSACSYCGNANFEDPQMTGRGTRIRCSDCGGTMKSWGGKWGEDEAGNNTGPQQAQSQWEPEFPNSSQNNASEKGDYRSGGAGGVVQAPGVDFKASSLQTEAGIIDWVVDKIYDRIQERTQNALLSKDWASPSHLQNFAGPAGSCSQCTADNNVHNLTVHSGLNDQEWGFHLTASWMDVQAKARKIRRTGGVKIVAASKLFVVGEVQGVHNVYESQLNYVVGTKKVADWSCGCKWASYTWGRSQPFRRFEGRLCSHALALQYEAGAKGMFGREIEEGPGHGKPVTVQWDKANDQHLTRGSSLRTAGLSFDHVGDDHDMSEVRNSHEGDTSSGSIHAHDERGNRVGELDYHLEPHGDGGDIHVDGPHMAPGHEHHGPAMVQALEHHLDTTRGLRGSRGWSYTHNMGDRFNPGLHSYSSLDTDGVYPDASVVDLAHPPIYAFAANMFNNGENIPSVVQMFASFGVQREAARSMVHDAWTEPALDEPESHAKRSLAAGWMTDTENDGDAFLEPLTASSYVNEQLFDQNAQKRNLTSHDDEPYHQTDGNKLHKHRTNDAREHAPHWGYPYGGMILCQQCNGSGCGHCAGTGQLDPDQAEDATETLTDQSPDETPDSGSGITGGVTSSMKMADYSVNDPLSGGGGQGYAIAPQHSNSTNPGSTGWATSQDPGDWGRSLISNSFGVTFDASLHTAKSSSPQEGPTVSGVALKAADTGRVLMIQRSNKDESDPAKGTWEFPGGHHEEGDQTSLHAGIREWQEEIGQPFPQGGHVTHVHRTGPYNLHTVVIPEESQVEFHNGRSLENPDDPDGDDHENAAWWEPDHAKKNPALRSELKGHASWGDIQKAAVINDLDAVMSVYTTLHDDPEAALPSTDGAEDVQGSVLAGNSVDGPHDTDDAQHIIANFLASKGAAVIANGDKELMAKVAMKDFSHAEQQELINEGRGDRARNFGDLKIAGTHYEKLPEDDSDNLWFL